MSNQNYEDWVELYYKKIKPFFPMLTREFKKKNLSNEQMLVILEGVFRRAVNDLR